MKKLSPSEYLDRCQTIHQSKYDYSKCKFTDLTSPIILLCQIHGEFTMGAVKHLYGGGCYKYGRIETGKKNSIRYVRNLDYFLEKANAIHRDRYDYSKSEYKNMTNNMFFNSQ